MTRDGLRTVAKLRRLVVLREQAELARRGAAEAEASRAEAEAQHAIALEMAAGSLGSGADAFATWLAAARRRCEQARVRRIEAQRAIVQARAELTEADVAQAAIDRLMERRAEAARELAARADQVLIDDLASRPRG